MLTNSGLGKFSVSLSAVCVGSLRRQHMLLIPPLPFVENGILCNEIARLGPMPSPVSFFCA